VSSREGLERTLASLVASAINQAIAPINTKIAEIERRQEALEALYEKVNKDVIENVVESSLNIAMTKATANISVNIDAIARSLDELKGKLEGLERTESSKNIEESIAKLDARLSELEKAIEALSKTEIKVDTSGFEKVLTSTTESIAKISKDVEITKEATRKLGEIIDDKYNKQTEEITKRVDALQNDLVAVKTQLQDLKRIWDTLSNLEASIEELKEEPEPQPQKGKKKGTSNVGSEEEIEFGEEELKP